MLEKLSCRSKVDRAKHHLADLQRMFAAFEQSDAYAVSHKDDTVAQERTYYVKLMEPIPIEFSLTAGDAIQNLRSALDHLIHAAFFKQEGSWPSDTQISFPVGKDLADYRSPKSRRHIRNLNQIAVSVIDDLKPYQGGNQTLWRIHISIISTNIAF